MTPERLCVFVVDDNQDAADTLGSLLQAMGYCSHVYYDAQSALDDTRRRRPAVALLDLGMPGMDGFELAMRLRQACPDTMLVACTGWGSAEMRLRAITAGFVHHMVKPIDSAELDLVLRHTPYTASQAQVC